MNIENTNISCDVCLDLIPLVRDKVASGDSDALVYEHIKSCENCKAEFENINITSENKIDDKKIIQSIRKSLLLAGFVFLVCGALLGVYLSNSFGMFYNFLLMPIVGSCGYLILKKKWYFTPVGIFVLSYVWLFIQNILDGALSSGFKIQIFWIPIFLSTIYTGLTILGVVIVVLLQFTFRKEGKMR